MSSIGNATKPLSNLSVAILMVALENIKTISLYKTLCVYVCVLRGTTGLSCSSHFKSYQTQIILSDRVTERMQSKTLLLKNQLFRKCDRNPLS